VFIAGSCLRPSVARVLISTAIAVTLVVGTRDWYVIRVSGAYGDISYLRYASVAFGLALLSIVVFRFRAASVQARQLLDTLATQLALREAELALTYGRIEHAATEHARTQERERILADMHDGVGTHLSAAIRQLQSGRARHEDLLDTLRDSLDQLKLSIDLTRLPSGDVGALLAALRYRLENRLTVLGLSFDWAVDELPLLPRLDERAIGLLQYFLFEAISNVLQHARASVLRVEARMDGAVLRLALIDDGKGFDATRAPRALAERAQSLGARLTIESRPGRTQVRLEIDAQA
jgi:signal transduction histidine kinase